MNRIILAVGAMALIAIGLVGSALWTSDYKTTLHTADIDWLPSSATDVSRQVRTGFGAIEKIECTMPEKDFLALAAARNWTIQPAEQFSASMRIERLPKLRVIPMAGPANIVLKGYKFQSVASNGGGITVCYDRDLMRMIYETSNR